MKTEIRIITPAVAKEMLTRNYTNRPVSKGNLKDLAYAMNNGQWIFDGLPIRFDKYGRLLDGQHRLLTVVATGISQQFLVISGLEEESFKVMDMGKRRSGSDALAVIGEQNSTSLAASISQILRFKKGKASKGGGGDVKTTNTDIINFLNTYPSIKDHVRNASTLSKSFSRVLPQATIASVLFLLSERSPSAAEDFVSKLCNGLGLYEKSPIVSLRKRLMDDKLNNASLPLQFKMAIIIKAWNYYRKGKTVTYLKFRKEEENFPTII